MLRRDLVLTHKKKLLQVLRHPDDHQYKNQRFDWRELIDEVDYLIGRSKTIETLRDLHDLTGAPVVLIGMQEAKTKLGKFRHLYDRISEIVEFKTFSKDDMEVIVEELSEIKITDEAKEIFFEKSNRFAKQLKELQH